MRLFVGIKFFAVTAEPVFTFFGLGIKFFDAFPESTGVILMFQVGNLMGDHVPVSYTHLTLPTNSLV